MVKAKSKSPDIELKAKIKGSDEWKDWNCNKHGVSSAHGSAGALYFVGFVGALFYWMQAAAGFGAVITGFLKALTWPAYVVYKLLESFYGIVI